MQAITITKPQAALELALWQAEAESMSSSDLYVWLLECGLPTEIAIRLKELINVTKRVGEKVISIGKVIVIKLMDFVKKHPNLVMGIALGAAISSLITAIPFLGPILAPVAILLGITVGAIAGSQLDNVAVKGASNENSAIQELIVIAREFFQLFIESIQALSDQFKPSATL
jgi:uncharacterized membrane protein